MVAPSEVVNLSRSWLNCASSSVRLSTFCRLSRLSRCFIRWRGRAAKLISSACCASTISSTAATPTCPAMDLAPTATSRRNSLLHRFHSECLPLLPHSRPPHCDRAMHRCPRKGPCLRSRVLWLLLAPTAGRLSLKQPSLWPSHIDWYRPEVLAGKQRACAAGPCMTADVCAAQVVLSPSPQSPPGAPVFQLHLLPACYRKRVRTAKIRPDGTESLDSSLTRLGSSENLPGNLPSGTLEHTPRRFPFPSTFPSLCGSQRMTTISNLNN